MLSQLAHLSQLHLGLHFTVRRRSAPVVRRSGALLRFDFALDLRHAFDRYPCNFGDLPQPQPMSPPRKVKLLTAGTL